MIKIAYVATDPVTAFRLMDGQLGYLRERGFDVTVITAPGKLLDRAASREGVRCLSVPMTRDISLGRDVLALWRLTRTLSRLKPDIVNAGTPKAGLLGVIAARLAGVPTVVYLLRGLRFEGARGAKRLVLAATEHVAAGLATHVFANSRSLRERFWALGCAERGKIWVPADGSSNGVDVERFTPTAESLAWAQSERARYGWGADEKVVGFVGRFVRDKGLVELLTAFRVAVLREPRLRLLLVGDHDATDPLPPEARKHLASDDRIVVTGFVDEPARYYHLMDVFAFPSVREGFPNAVLEAAAAELPVVAFRATGTIDAVVDGVTGRLIPQGDVASLTEELVRYAMEPPLARRQGIAGRQWVEAKFRREVIWKALELQYRRLAGCAQSTQGSRHLP